MVRFPPTPLALVIPICPDVPYSDIGVMDPLFATSNPVPDVEARLATIPLSEKVGLPDVPSALVTDSPSPDTAI